MSSVLVTGGAGFIGSHLCERLIERGERVVCYDNFNDYYDPALKRRNVSGLKQAAEFHLVEADILDGDALEAALKTFQVDRIIHLAALAGVRPSLGDPVAYQRVNVCGTTEVLDAARRSGIEVVVVASSSSVYGNGKAAPSSEDETNLRPISPYAASKRAAEVICSVYAEIYGMSISCHRLFTVYGPRQRPDMAISRFVNAVRRGDPVDVYGDGTARRDFTFVGDIVTGLILALDRARSLGFQTFNLGESDPVTVSQLIRIIGSVACRDPQIRYQAAQAGDVDSTWADISKARRMLDYEPATTLLQGIRKYVAWLDGLA